DPGTSNIFTLSLHDALPILGTGLGGTLSGVTLNGNLSAPNGTNVTITNGLTLNGTATLTNGSGWAALRFVGTQTLAGTGTVILRDRKSTRLNSSHVEISYAV